jgi:hypothetical protein
LNTPKLIKIKYEAEVAVFDQQTLIDAKDKLYDLFDEVLYNSAESVTGVQMLIGSTQLRMEGETE